MITTVRTSLLLGSRLLVHGPISAEPFHPAPTPIMGWSSWNHFRINIDEAMIREQADAMISSGLHAAGYRFLNIDDGYFGGRDAQGKLFSHELKFPSGMKALADYIRANGLKPGIYSDAGANTCGSYWDNDARGVGVGLHEEISLVTARYVSLKINDSGALPRFSEIQVYDLP